jgi:hypothetical protein
MRDATHVPVPRLGILITLRARHDFGERWDTVYAESLELAADASRIGVDDIWSASIAAQPTATALRRSLRGRVRSSEKCWGSS